MATYSFGFILYFFLSLFFGVKAAVLAVVLEAVVRIGRRALKNRVMLALSALVFIAIFFLRAPFPLVVLAAGAPWRRFVLEVNPVKWGDDRVIAVDGLLVIDDPARA